LISGVGNTLATVASYYGPKFVGAILQAQAGCKGALAACDQVGLRCCSRPFGQRHTLSAAVAAYLAAPLYTRGTLSRGVLLCCTPHRTRTPAHPHTRTPAHALSHRAPSPAPRISPPLSVLGLSAQGWNTALGAIFGVQMAVCVLFMAYATVEPLDAWHERGGGRPFYSAVAAGASKR
jgi:hypothetical protein